MESNFCFKVFNTIRVEYLSKMKPGNDEIVRLLKELEFDAEGIFGFYGSETENAFFIKYVNSEELQNYCDAINDKKFMIIDNVKCEVTAAILGTFLTEVYLHSLPFEVSDQEIERKLQKYGRIKEIKWQKCETDKDFDVFNGTRIITMQLNKVIPPYVFIRDVKVRAYYKYQREMCYKCLCITTHYRNCCNTSVTKTTPRPIRTPTDKNMKTNLLEDNQSFADDNQGDLSITKHFEELEELTDDTNNFVLVSKKSKKKKNMISKEEPFEIPVKWKPKSNHHFIFDYNTSETESIIIQAKKTYGYGGDAYPTNNLLGRYLSMRILKQMSLEDNANEKIKEALKETKRFGIKLDWFLCGKMIYYKVVES